MIEYIDLIIHIQDQLECNIYIEITHGQMWRRITVNGELLCDDPAVLTKQRQALLSQVEDLEVHKWQREYGEPSDGMVIYWHLDYKRQGKRCRHITGYDDFPLDWDDFMSLIDRLAPEAQLIADAQLDAFEFDYMFTVNKGTKNAWLYSETLAADRATKTLTYTRRVFDACVIKHECFAKQIISHVLDMVSDLINDCDFMEPTEECNPSMRIHLRYHDNDTFDTLVPYNRHGVTDEWNYVIEGVGRFLDAYGLFGDIFNPDYYRHGVKEDEFIYCSVAFDDSRHTYYYMTTDDTLMVGDQVIVPTGEDNEEKVARIEHIGYYYAEDVPYPLEKTKSIIERYNENDYDYDRYLKTVS